MTELTISVPPALKQWIDERVAQGLYADATDFVRALLRRDQEQAAEDDPWLKAMIDEGLQSGRLHENPKDVLWKIMTDHPADRG